jgi:hypothetical protein
MKTGSELIEEERTRQISQEGHNAQGDAVYVRGQLITAAIAYLFHESADKEMNTYAYDTWPWSGDSFKPHDGTIRNLVKAGALIAAEIDRLNKLQ